MKLYFVLLGVILALLAWFFGTAVLTVWVGANFGDDWVFFPAALGAAPVVAGILLYIWEMS